MIFFPFLLEIIEVAEHKGDSFLCDNDNVEECFLHLLKFSVAKVYEKTIFF